MDPEKPYLYDKILGFWGDFLACGEVLRRDKPARTRPGGPNALPVILRGILHFSRKALRFAPNSGTILLLVPARFSGWILRKSAWCGQNRPDETACFHPGGVQTAFGTQNSKCDRALTAPPEFKSLMLRQMWRQGWKRPCLLLFFNRLYLM